MRTLLVLLCCLLMLSGCASCRDVAKLRPTVPKTEGFAVLADPNLDSLFLEHESLSLWLKPCLTNSGAEVHGSLCGTYIVPPKKRFMLENATVALRQEVEQQVKNIRLVPLDFKIDVIEVGSGEPTTGSWLANRPYQLPGSWLQVRFLASGDAPSRSELKIPNATIDGRTLIFPSIFLAPEVGQTCVHYH
jgi:hypothetical protein